MTIVEGVYVARTLTPTDRFTDVPVQVMNVQSQPIKAGTTISNLEPVDVFGCPSSEAALLKEREDAVSEVADREDEVSDIKTVIVEEA